MGERHNRLIHEKSPYLLQHATNPVEWYPWGEEAFQKAAREGKPVFLSIGYSTCHWCHVMAHESFEDEKVARLMNEVFVSVKVDREERPDIDGVYMTVCQMMTGSGGWPLTVITTPDKKPFYAATYIPRESRFGKAGMLELIPNIARIWAEKRDTILEVADEAVRALHEYHKGRSIESIPDEAVLAQARRDLENTFDRQFGGFGIAPKFPNVPFLLFLLRHWRKTGEEGVLRMVEKTLFSMRLGGIYDHVGFGFHRYSTDQNWLVPHFEKMLYDQALLLMAYTEAFQATGETLYSDTAREIAAYVMRALTSPEGGFYSAEDADSEGVEGKFYLWETGELADALPPEEFELAKKLFGIESGGNYYDEVMRSRSGKNIVHLKQSLPDAARSLHMSQEELKATFESLRQKLFFVRESRPHPHRDDKVLTDWNGLMIAAMAKAARVLEDAGILSAAERALRFIMERMCGEEGRVFHRYRDGERAVPGILDDYAFLTWGLLELYESTFEGSYLLRALDLQTAQFRHFWDEESGGFFLTADDSEEVLLRRKELYDGAIPSGSSVSLLNICRLGRMTGEGALAEKAQELMKAWGETVRRSPSVSTFFLLSADFVIGRSFEIVVVGERGEQSTERMIGALRTRYLPNKVVVLKDSSGVGNLPLRVREHVRGHRKIDGKTTCYICTNYECLPPVTDVAEMLSGLGLEERVSDERKQEPGVDSPRMGKPGAGASASRNESVSG